MVLLLNLATRALISSPSSRLKCTPNDRMIRVRMHRTKNIQKFVNVLICIDEYDASCLGPRVEKSICYLKNLMLILQQTNHIAIH